MFSLFKKHGLYCVIVLLMCLSLKSNTLQIRCLVLYRTVFLSVYVYCRFVWENNCSTPFDSIAFSRLYVKVCFLSNQSV